MMIIDYLGSFELIHDFVRGYNEVCIVGENPSGSPRYDLKRKLRPAHENLLRALIRLYAKQLSEYEWLNWKDNLPPFRTNSVALGTLFGCDPKTIRSQIQRLIESGAILEKVHRGRKHNYELVFSEKVLKTTRGIYPRQHKRQMERQQQRAEREEIESEIRTRNPQLEAGNSNNKNNRDGGNVDGENESRDAEKENRGEGTGNEVTGNPRLQKCNENRSGDQHNRLQKRAARSSRPEWAEKPAAAERRPPKGQAVRVDGTGDSNSSYRLPVPEPVPLDWNKLDDYFIRLYSVVLAALYPRLEFMAQSQSFAIKRYLALQFAGHDPGEYEQIYQQLRVRVMMAADWLERDARRYIPIPAVYFDLDNPTGFNRTADWYAESAHNRNKIEACKARYRSLMKAWGGFMSVVGNAVQRKDWHSYSEGRRRVNERYSGLLDAYDYVILDALHSPETAH